MEVPCKVKWRGEIETHIRRWTDNYTDSLFHPDFQFSALVNPVRYPYSRFFCDVERLEQDPMEQIGQGIVYSQFQDCTREIGYEERMLALQSYYQHQCNLHSATEQRLTNERAKAIAVEELVRIYTDVKETAEDEDKDVSDWFWDKYHADRLEAIRRQMRLLKEFDTIRQDLQDGKIGKQEYRMQAWLLADMFAQISKSE